MLTLPRIEERVAMQDLVWYPSKMPMIYMLIRLQDYGGDLPRIWWVTPDYYTQDLSNPAINFYLGSTRDAYGGTTGW